MTGQETGLAGPTLLVRHGAEWAAEHRYILHVLGEQLGLRLKSETVAGLQWVEIRCPQASAVSRLQLGANLLLRPKEQWLTSTSMPLLPLTNWEPRALLPSWKLGPLPVLYPPIRMPSAALSAPDSLYLPLDLLGGAFFLLTRYEELVTKEQDEHGRFPTTATWAYKAGCLLRPVVDEYSELLRLALLACFPGLPCRQPSAQFRISHDVDHPFQFFGKSFRQMVVSAAKGFYHHPTPSAAWRLLRGAFRAGLAGNAAADPFNTYDVLMEASEHLGTSAEFYFMSGVTNKRYEEAYQLLQPALQTVLRQIHERGHVIGLHASYAASHSGNALAQELSSLRRATEHAGIHLQSVGGRQHYLRWQHPTTWRCWDKAGLAYDATLGFADHIGFRCGTAREFPAFDPTTHQQLRLRARPLLAMDVTLTEYMGLSAAASATQLETLWQVVCRSGGTLEVLIHNCHPLAPWLAQSLVQLKSASGN